MSRDVLFVTVNAFVNDSRIEKEAATLSNAGYNVVIAALYKEGLPKEDYFCGVKVNRVVLKTAGLSKIKILRVISYIEFLLLVICFYSRFNIVHCHDLPALPVGFFYKLFRRDVKLVYDAHEFESDQIPGQGVLKTKVIGLVERFFIRNIDFFITVSDPIARKYGELFQVPNQNLLLNVPVYSIPKKRNIFRDKFDISKDVTIVLYQGLLGRGRGLEILVNFFLRTDRKDVVFVLMGYGELYSEIEKIAKNSKNVFLHDAVARKDLLEHTASADVGICLGQGQCFSHKYCLPNKLFEYTMARLPVIVAPLPELTKIVQENQIGVVAEGYSDDDISLAINTIQGLDRNAFNQRISQFNGRYNWEAQEPTLLSLYEQCFQ